MLIVLIFAGTFMQFDYISFNPFPSSVIRKKPALGLDPKVDIGFPKRSCPAKNLDHDPILSDWITV